MRRIDRRSAPWLSHHLNGSLLYHKRCVAFSPNDAHDAECTVVRIVANAMRFDVRPEVPRTSGHRAMRPALSVGFSRAGRRPTRDPPRTENGVSKDRDRDARPPFFSIWLTGAPLSRRDTGPRSLLGRSAARSARPPSGGPIHEQVAHLHMILYGVHGSFWHGVVATDMRKPQGVQ
jgi:hypothetical protein